MNDATSSRSIRFSLRHLLLMMTIVALGIGLVVVAWNNHRLDQTNQSLVAENRRLRDEVGELSIEDPSQLHAIRVETDSYLEWVWRVWIPEGREYRLRCVANEVPKTGFPQQRGGTIMVYENGEQAIRYRIRRDPRDGKLYGSISAAGGSSGKHEHPWVEWRSRVATTGGVGTSTRVFPPGEVVEICRHRVSQASSSVDIEDPAAGFLIWLEPMN